MQSSSCAAIGKILNRGRASINTVRTFDYGHSYDSFIGNTSERARRGRARDVGHLYEDRLWELHMPLCFEWSGVSHCLSATLDTGCQGPGYSHLHLHRVPGRPLSRHLLLLHHLLIGRKMSITVSSIEVLPSHRLHISVVTRAHDCTAIVLHVLRSH